AAGEQPEVAVDAAVHGGRGPLRAEGAAGAVRAERAAHPLGGRPDAAGGLLRADGLLQRRRRLDEQAAHEDPPVHGHGRFHGHGPSPPRRYPERNAPGWDHAGFSAFWTGPRRSPESVPDPYPAAGPSGGR